MDRSRRARASLELEHLEARDTPAVADIAVEKTDGLAAMREGSSTTYTIRVTNNGPDAVSNVTIDDPFPLFPFNTKSWFASGISGATVNQTTGTGPLTILANLPVGGVVQISASLFVFPRSGGTLVNTVTATLAPGDTDPNPANNSATDRTDVGATVIPDGPGGTLYAVGSDSAAGHVVAYLAGTGQLVHSFLPFAGYQGAVRVATGDVTGDGFDDIVVGTGPGAPPHVKVFDGRSLREVASFMAFDPAFRGGVFVAAARFNPSPLGTSAPHNEGQVVVGADAGALPHVRVFSVVSGRAFPNTPLSSFLAYDASFRGGVRVAAGDLDGQLGDELVTAPGVGVPAHVKAFHYSGATVASFYAFEQTFQGGAFVAVGNVDGTGGGEIIVGANQGPPRVQIFDGTGSTERAQFLAFDGGFPGGVRVGSVDRNRDGRADLVLGAGPGAGPHVRVLSGDSLAALDSFFAFGQAFNGGVFVG